jgi:hypothetical protein
MNTDKRVSIFLSAFIGVPRRLNLFLGCNLLPANIVTLHGGGRVFVCLSPVLETI